MTETEWISYLRKFLFQREQVLATHNEDCAVIKYNDHYLLLTTDALVEKVHFRLEYTDYYSLGYKLASTNLSDIAAMGGEPRWALFTLGSPQPPEPFWLDPLMEGLVTTLENFGAHLIGGDTVKSELLFLSLTLIGETDKPLLRKGAKPGDYIFVSKELGKSAAFLRYIRELPIEEIPTPVVEAHLRPTPEIELGKAIRYIANSAIDISDGLLLDLYRLCWASGVSAELDLSRIPISPYATLEEALSGGEDYALLFTIPEEKIEELYSLSSKLNLNFYYIGKIIKDNHKIFLIKDKGERVELSPRGFDHFISLPRF